MNTISKLIAGLVLVSMAEFVLAGETQAVSEPGTMTLLGVAGVVAAVAAIRRWRK